MEKLTKSLFLLCLFIIGIIWGYVICSDVKNKEIHKQQETINKQANAIQNLERQKSYEIPKYLDSIPDYE